MAATVTTEKVQVRVNLDNGTDSQGNVKIVGVSLPKLSVSGYTADKAMAIVNALDPMLVKTVYSVSEIKTGNISEE